MNHFALRTVLVVGFGLMAGAAVAQSPVPAKPPAVRTILQQADVAANPAQMTYIGTVDIAPGSGNPPHTHSGTEMGYVVSGRITMSIQGQPTRTLGPGDSFLIPRGLVHHSDLIGNEPAKLVSTWTIDKDKPFMVPAP